MKQWSVNAAATLTVVCVQCVFTLGLADGVLGLAHVAPDVGVRVVVYQQLAGLRVCRTEDRRQGVRGDIAKQEERGRGFLFVLTLGGGGGNGAPCLSLPRVAEGDGAQRGLAAEGDGCALLFGTFHPALGLRRGNCGERVQRVSGSDGCVCSDLMSWSGSAGKTSRNKRRKQLLTHHHQRQLVCVHARRLLHFALVGGRVRQPRVGDGDGGVAHFGVSGEPEPRGDGGVTIAVRLAAGVGQDLKGGDLVEMFPQSCLLAVTKIHFGSHLPD